MIGVARRACEAEKPYDWREDALCAKPGVDPELFHPIGYKSGPDQLQVIRAREVCNACPVKQECLNFAVEKKIPDGILGGLTPDERSIYMKGN